MALCYFGALYVTIFYLGGFHLYLHDLAALFLTVVVFALNSKNKRRIGAEHEVVNSFFSPPSSLVKTRNLLMLHLALNFV